MILEGFGDKVCADMSKMLAQHAKELSLSQKEIIGTVCHINTHDILEYSRPRPIPTEWWSITDNFKHQAGKTAAAKRPCEKSSDDAPVAKAPRFDNGIGMV